MVTRDSLAMFRDGELSDTVTRLEGLLAQGQRVFLVGAGCSKCAGLPLTAELTAMILDSDRIDATTRAILTSVANTFSGARCPHIEDYLSEIIDHLSILNRRSSRGATSCRVSLDGTSYGEEELSQAVEQIKLCIADAVGESVSTEAHREFVRAVHGLRRIGRAAAEPVDYLVLNYDTLLEDALALERVPFADGLEGGVTGWWDPETFERQGLSARVLKLHGSVNWCAFPDDPLPRRVSSCIRAEMPGTRPVLIWPASTKYRETQLDPYAQLAHRARVALRPEDGLQKVLVICGYSFGDRHINMELDRALRQSSGNLTVIAFTSVVEQVDQLKQWLDDRQTREQVLVYYGHGFMHGDTSICTDEALPWWKFENMARLLGGER